MGRWGKEVYWFKPSLNSSMSFKLGPVHLVIAIATSSPKRSTSIATLLPLYMPPGLIVKKRDRKLFGLLIWRNSCNHPSR